MIDKLLASRSDPKLVPPLYKEAVNGMLETRGTAMQWGIAALGPIAGVADGIRKRTGLKISLKNRIFYALAVKWVLYVAGVKKRPGYNDFLICRWAILNDEESAELLIERSKRHDNVGATACWALNSLSQQFQEFNERFPGRVEAPNPLDMLRGRI